MKKIFLSLLIASCLVFSQGNAIFKVTDFPDNELCPRVSPDGQRLAYVDLKFNGPFPIANIRVSTADGQNSMLATTGQSPQTGGVPIDNQYPSWFPNGSQVIYERLVPIAAGTETYEIWSVPFNSSNGTRLIQNNYNFSIMPDVSVNGDVAFVTSGNLQSPFPGYPMTRYGNVPPPAAVMKNFMIAIQPAGQTVVLNSIPGLYPHWNPDGKLIAYSSWNPTTGWDIFVADYTMERGLTNFRQITSDPGDEFVPSWSPDGKWIAYAYARPQSSSPVNIFVINIFDGTRIQETLEPNSIITMPDWTKTADGKEYIYCCSNMDGDFDIYRLVPLLGNTSPVSSSSQMPPAPGGMIITPQQQQQKNAGKVRIIVLNTSTDKTADISQSFASKVAQKITEWNDSIFVSSVINGSDSGEPHVYYFSEDFKKLADNISLFLDGLINNEILYSETEYSFFPSEPLSNSPYKLNNVDILIEAPAN